ncbi:MAG: DsbA family protein [Nitrospira sp.]|nr:DsbA family protein [Nitrospira sp.]
MISKRFLGLFIVLLILSAMSISLHAGTSPLIRGVHTIIESENFKFDGKTVEVIEFMSFYCHTCYDFESAIPVIKGNFPKKINWKTVPIYWSEHGSPKPGEAYLLAEEAGKGEAMKKALFKAQMVEKRNIGDVSVLDEIAGKIGLGADFSKKLRSGEKAEEVQKAVDLSRKYGISETPTLIIAGNIKTDPHPMEHDLNRFKLNALSIIGSILK